MNGNSALLDTNIFIYFLKGIDEAKKVFNSYENIYFSVITKIELLSSQKISVSDAERIISLLNSCKQIPLDEKVTQYAISLRKKYRLKTPDAIIFASAFCFNIPLVTGDEEIYKIAEFNVSKFE